MGVSDWTEGRVKSFITSVLRAGSRKWPPKYETLKEAYVETKTNTATGRLAKHYKCNMCKCSFPSKEVAVDHIKPVISPETGFTTWDSFITNLFCSKENLQVLCKSCHDNKTASEKIKRKKNE